MTVRDFPKDRVHIIIARTEGEGMEAARAFGLSSPIYPRHPAELLGYLADFTLVYIDGWTGTRQPVSVVRQATRLAEDTVHLPTADGLRYGTERAQLAADRLARLREAKRSGSPFLEAAGIPQAAEQVNTWAQRLHHWLHLCPTRRAGLPCTVPPGTCRWPS